MHKKNVELIAKALKCTYNKKSANKIIDRININGGFCPCVTPNNYEEGKNYQCPCDDLVEHLKKNGKCHCNLFIKKKPFWKFWSKK